MSLPRPLLPLAILLSLSAAGHASVIFPGPGWTTTLSTNSHLVSGSVTILDEDSLVVENFNLSSVSDAT